MIHKYLHFARHSLTTPLHSPSMATLLAFFAAQHPTSELFGTLLAFFAARNLTSEPFSDALDHFCHLASMQPIFPDSAVSSSIAPKTTFY